MGRYPRFMEVLPGHLERLPAGGDRFQAELLSRDQRERILMAMFEIVAKRGYQGTTVELIVKRAGVARATFYENFENREACLLAGFEETVADARAQAEPAVAAAKEWPQKVAAAIAALLDYVVADPARARTCLVETVSAGPPALERYEQAMASFAPALAAGRAYTSESARLPETLEDSIVGGIVWMVHLRLQRGEVDQIPALLPTMLEFSLAPYLGETRAAEIAATAAGFANPS